MSTSLNKARQVTVFFCFGAACLLTLFLYHEGLNGYFMMDDEPSLSAMGLNGGVTSLNHAEQFIFGNNTGALGRPVSMASFLIDDQYWPASPYDFKRTNLAIHILTGLLIFWLLWRLFRPLNHSRALWVALVASVLWLIHPMNVSTVLYVIQRMTILMTLFSVFALIFYCYARFAVDQQPSRGYLFVLGCGLALLLAIFSKENGVLVLLYIAIVELTLFANLQTSHQVRMLRLMCVYIPLCILVAYFVFKFGVYIDGYKVRDFSMMDRLLTQPRVLGQYLFYILLPQPSVGSLVHDGYVVSTSLFQPISTLFGILLLFFSLIVGLIYRKRFPVLSFGILWFLGGHILESSFIGLEIYFEHRNYLPMVGPIAAIVWGLVSLWESLASKPKVLISSIGGLFSLWTCLVTYQTTTLWGNPSALYRVWAVEHPNSPRAQRILGQLLGVEGKSEEAIHQLIMTYEKFPYDIGVLIDAKRIACENGLPQPVSLAELAKLAEGARYVDGISYYIENLVTSVNNETCVSISDDDVLNIIQIAKALPLVNGETRAKMLLWAADIFIGRKDLNGAMAALDEAFDGHKHPAIPLLQSKLLFSAGLWAEAQSFLSLAEELALRKESKYSVLLKNIETHKNLQQQVYKGSAQ